MTHVTCRQTAKNRHQLRNSTLGNRVRASFTPGIVCGGLQVAIKPENAAAFANNAVRRLVTAALGPLADHVTSRVKARKSIKAGKYNLPNNLQVLFSR